MSVNIEANSLQSTELNIFELKAEGIDYIPADDFEKKEAWKVFVEAPLPAAASRVRRTRPSGVPSYFAHLYETPLLTPDQEVYLFRKYNYLKHVASDLLESLHPTRPSAKKIAKIQDLLARADEVRSQIIQANLRLVVSIARRFVDANSTFDDLVGEGNISLMYAVDKFNYSKGFRFSTYATHAIQRGYFRTTAKRQKENSRFILGAEADQFVQEQNEEDVDWNQQHTLSVYRALVKCMDAVLDDREKFILMARFGLDNEQAETQTLKDLAGDLGICKERVRQLQNRALDKLQSKARDIKVEAPIAIA